MKLVIVESPTKANTISKFLGDGYQVESSYGHVRDLPKSKLGIDISHGFMPTYVILPKAKERVAALKKIAGSASEIILACDEDREGEAIAWHLTQALGLAKSKIKNQKSKLFQRIAFHEITKSAIEEALEHPRAIDMNLVDAQQARRVLDRLVGYELSPFLWRKVRFGLSAGRVQSVAVRLIVEREREIQNFQKEEYWTIEGEFSKLKGSSVFPARLHSIDGNTLEKMAIVSELAAQKIIDALKSAQYAVKEISSKMVTRLPAPPFTTSTLQQEASRKLGFSAKQTMMLAQNLYEKGYITYMRTDSVYLAEQAVRQAKEEIVRRFGNNYGLDQPRRFVTRTKGAQEAHEAIRPTDLSKTQNEISFPEKKHQRLYELIWKRTMASQMKEGLFEQTNVDIATSDKSRTFPEGTNPADSGKVRDKKYLFRANGQVTKFDGFLKVYAEGRDETNGKETEGSLPELREGEIVKANRVLPLQHFTEPPPRYTDATLVKTLEAAGIGRPSTYAPILSTIQDRGYAEKIEKQYHPTETGIIVNDILVEHFPEIIDINFTSHIEEELDEIAEGKIGWTIVTKEFYEPFKKHLTEKEAEVQKYTELSDMPCPHCGKKMLIKFGRFGKFLACPEPGVKITLPLPEEAAKIEELKEKTKGEHCPLCDKPMAVKRGRFGFFLGCADYPKCKGIKKIFNKTGFLCPVCQASDERKNEPGAIVEKRARGRRNVFYGCSRYPDCAFIMNKKPESEQEVQKAYEAWKNKPAKDAIEEKPAVKTPKRKTNKGA